MIIAFLLQLLIGTLIVLSLLGVSITLVKRTLELKFENISLILTSILMISVYCIIAYYFSKSLDLYIEVHKNKIFATILNIFLLLFLLNGPSRYTQLQEEKGQILFSTIISIAFFILIRFFPSIGDALFGWVPIVIWV
jgi:membrane-associated HD superfamily phosphohydrolase